MGLLRWMAMALFAAHLSIQRRLQSIVPDKRATSNSRCTPSETCAFSSRKHGAPTGNVPVCK
jgi:hypothetical protein